MEGFSGWGFFAKFCKRSEAIYFLILHERREDKRDQIIRRKEENKIKKSNKIN